MERNRIIILDEASASCDEETDAKIQAALRHEFSNSTIICIAHRIKTIIDYDKVLVLNRGEMVEFDSPGRLLADTRSVFTGMCQETGEIDLLRELVV